MNARRWVQAAARAYDRVRVPHPGVVVLIYHRVGGGTNSVVDLTPEEFDAQVATLAATTTVLTLDDAVAGLAAGHAVQGVVVTFDDGTRDFHEHAVPVLERHGVPATLYAATRFIDSGDPMPWGAPSATWQGLRAAVATGLVTIGSHTADHRLLHNVDRTEATRQLHDASTSIIEQIGVAPRHFAYPKAMPGNAVAEIAVRERFASAALAGSRSNRPGDDLHRLWRTPVHRGDTAELFAHKLAGGLRLEGAVRDMVTRWRAPR